ncbi:hypothetical protein J437_LFUL011694 [Ladona fulva]|uniref:Uncharacterized protein n=1 Tax=Ladona fulva TaxID=123851 RepID=A0A8K0JYE5_LADFU|nr:hypothetical protein J437_LFUL011694 [Ladona fulva]
MNHPIHPKITSTGTPPTESTAKWESFRRAGDARPGEDSSHRVQNRHGILLRADPPERTTPPARSPWAIRREEGVRWEGRGSSPSPPSNDKPREDQPQFTYEESEGIPEVEVVLDGREEDLTQDPNRTKSQSARSPYARASEAQRPTNPSIAHLPEASGSHAPPPSASLKSMTAPSSMEWDAAAVNGSLEEDVQLREGKEEERDGVRRRNHRQWEGEHGEEIVEGEREEDEEGSEEEGRDNHGEWEEDEEEEGSEESEEGEDESDEDVLEEEKDGREERRQHQASNKIATEGIPVFNMLTKILKRLNSSSNPKELEVSGSKNGTMGKDGMKIKGIE